MVMRPIFYFSILTNDTFKVWPQKSWHGPVRDLGKAPTARRSCQVRKNWLDGIRRVLLPNQAELCCSQLVPVG